MPSFKTADLDTLKTQQILQASIAPRPIALVSTVSASGEVNLSPFSYFNCFSANPPILVFSPARRVRDNTTKHTLENVLEVAECVIHIVTADIVEQMSLSSTEYDKGVNEFIKAGFTQIPSDMVKAPRIKEASIGYECKVNQVIALGEQNGAGNLVICEVLAIHIKDELYDSTAGLDATKLPLVARMGGSNYCKASGDALFQIPKPLKTKGIGFDSLPDYVIHNDYLSMNNKARLANVEAIPEGISKDKKLKEYNLKINDGHLEEHLNVKVVNLLLERKTEEAWILLRSYYEE